MSGLDNIKNQLSNYESFDHIGTGAFGTVYKARDKAHENRFVAMKKIRVPLTDDGIPMSTLREIALLKTLESSSHKNIVRLYDICHGKRNDSDLVIFLVFEHVEQDLACFLEKCPPPGLDAELICDLFHQMMEGIDFLHANRIVHRDLKPQNILVTDKRVVKLADFGLARIYEYQMRLTPIVVTLWYRAPEVLMQMAYASPVDMWSLGCILAELHNRKPLFSGKSESDQLVKIIEILGVPEIDEWPEDYSLTRDQFARFKKGIPLETLIPEIIDTALSMLASLLRFDPNKRLTAREALQHEYFAQLRQKYQELSASENVGEVPKVNTDGAAGGDASAARCGSGASDVIMDTTDNNNVGPVHRTRNNSNNKNLADTRNANLAQDCNANTD